MANTNADEVIERLNRINIRRLVEDGLAEAAKKIEAAAVEYCPIDTGQLSLHITYVVSNLTAVIGTNTEYGPYVEFGTGLYAIDGNGRKTPWIYTDEATGEKIWTVGQYPQPFLYPAFAENKDYVKRAIAKSVKDGIRR